MRADRPAACPRPRFRGGLEASRGAAHKLRPVRQSGGGPAEYREEGHGDHARPAARNSSKVPGGGGQGRRADVREIVKI